MKALLFILFTLLSNHVAACDKGPSKDQAFALKHEDRGVDSELNYYSLYIPIKLKKMYVYSIYAQLASTFDLGLNFIEQGEYEGDYYITYLGVAPSSENEVTIKVSYNAPYKDRRAIALCGNFKFYKLSDLLKVIPPAKRPEMPPPPPPPRPESDDV
ncbi:hypothetical protein [Rheinheimera baltica]|uniref:hypothetical protein n=1 Tax=Rheinheimera baltica TaxID=67576 RepID=UPI00273D2A34|nr:hypothetical protein [Rheinheimera baltica]MDP5144450.1 hypothetical protein [Rheinheimera baltica]MDP5191677.1 hypothetical protein [Rheinheimera baltica]